MLGKNGAKMKQNFRYTWQESKDLNLKPQTSVLKIDILPIKLSGNIIPIPILHQNKF